jgi:hypothetical protein
MIVRQGGWHPSLWLYKEASEREVIINLDWEGGREKEELEKERREDERKKGFWRKKRRTNKNIEEGIT